MNALTREIQAQERKTTAFETTARHIESDIKKKTIELHSKNILYIFFIIHDYSIYIILFVII